MRKQALAFFTMFSLILMLSIYYITLPKESNTTKQYESVISSLDETKDENREDKLITNENIIADANTNIRDKEDAIIENEQIKENIKKEEEISQKITTLGYENSVEINEQTIKISILNKKENDDIAISVMQEVYKSVGKTYLIEVSFTSQ